MMTSFDSRLEVVFNTRAVSDDVKAGEAEQSGHEKKQAERGFNLSARRTRKALFLDESALVVPWRELVALIATASPVGALE